MPTSDELRMLQALPLDLKVRRTEQRIREWVDYWGKDYVYVSFSGGKDSTVLLHIVRKMYGDAIPAVFVNTGMEYPEVQRFVRSFENVVILHPKLSMAKIFSQYGYPVISKEVSDAICGARRFRSQIVQAESAEKKTVIRAREGPNSDAVLNTNVSWDLVRTLAANYAKGSSRAGRMLGVGMGAPRVRKKGIPERSRYSYEKYKPLLDADFLISAYCCNVNKKGPLHRYQKETQRMPFVGTMADESFMRKQKWMQYGCNIFTEKNAVSKPLSFWTEQDVLHYIVEESIPICEIYGEIVPMNPEGQCTMCGPLSCTKCQRQGCFGCAYGLHMETKGETRFMRLARTHPRLYDYCINGGAYDPEDGFWKPTKDGLGMGHVFDEMNRLLPTKTGRPYIRYLPEGGEMERARKLDEEKKKG